MKYVQVSMKPFRLSRRIGGRKTIFGLVAGTAVSLLLLTVLPDPVPNIRSQNLGHRRIQQEEDDYTAPKLSAAAALRGEEALNPADLNLQLQQHVAAHSQKEPQGSIFQTYKRRKNNDDGGVGKVKELLPLQLFQEAKAGAIELNVSSKVVDIPRTKDKQKEIMSKAQETALTALQHGFKLTEGQKKLIEKMSPEERKALENRVSKVRLLQEKTYIQQLRIKGQVKPRKGGGEEVISTPKMPVRFPASLQKVHPKDWLPQYNIFLNITHYPWATSPTCSNYSIAFSPPETLPTKALASFPSSGNTWIRYLLECATGLFSGSLYDDTSLIKKGMYGEGIVYNSGMTILQKSHGYTTGDAMKLPHIERLSLNHMEELGYNGVLVVRNPFKALISHRHLDTGGHTGYAPKAHFLGKGWAEFVTLKIMLWRDFNVDWLTYARAEDIHVIFYEKVKDDLIDEMRKTLMYLNLPVDEERLKCLGQNSDGLFKRKPSKNVPLDFNPFTQELKQLVYEAIDDVNKVLRLKGKDQLPLSLYQFYDEREAKVALRARNDIDAIS